jgi:hypothetical protein
MLAVLQQCEAVRSLNVISGRCLGETKQLIRNCIRSLQHHSKYRGLGSPAFAQAFSASYGTGNSMPTYFDKDGALHLGLPPQRQQAGCMHSQAVVLGSPATRALGIAFVAYTVQRSCAELAK